MEKTITKEILKNELYAGHRPAIELLYTHYSGMLYSYILQFVPGEAEASDLLVDIFSALTPRLQTAFDSSLSVYCWLQVESRKIILEYVGRQGGSSGHANKGYYSSLLEETSAEHQWVFRELFICGRRKEELAAQSGKDLTYISGLLRECLLIIRKNLE